jgi:D-alanyl-D-alanine carboxypeptidase/D-alanyl-D-alanine-endopeptidase (penicillin-binding protein 4)
VAASLPALGRAVRRAAKPKPPAVSPALRRLRLTLRLAFRHVAGPGAAVYDLTAHRSLFVLDPGRPRPPASVEKLYTSLAILDRLGPGARLATTVMGAGHLGARGVWHGSLYLRGGGDPTFGDGTFNRAWNDGYGPTAAQLAGQLSRRGIHRVTGAVIGDPTLFDSARGAPNTHFAPDIPDLGGELAGLTYDHGSTAGALTPGAFAARELVLTMGKEHIRARAGTRTARTPTAAKRLASVSSPSMLTMLGLMNVRSDDLFAELLAKQLGARFGGAGTTAAGARVVSSTIGRYGIHPSIVDGSGLSRSDRSSPSTVEQLLRSVWHTMPGRELDSTLPVVGVSGTTARIGVHTRAQGRCIAKTGTLDGVTNLAGYCHAAHGHMVAFALFLDGPTLDQARALLTRMVGAVASY